MMNEYDKSEESPGKNITNQKDGNAARINHKFMTVGMMNDIAEQDDDDEEGASTPKMSDRKPNKKCIIRPTLFDSELVMNTSI